MLLAAGRAGDQGRLQRGAGNGAHVSMHIAGVKTRRRCLAAGGRRMSRDDPGYALEMPFGMPLDGALAGWLSRFAGIYYPRKAGQRQRRQSGGAAWAVDVRHQQYQTQRDIDIKEKED